MTSRTPRSSIKLLYSIRGRISKHDSPGNESYKDCKISDEWADPGNFTKWYDANYIDGWEIDKDLLGWEDKIYSKETCCFLPPRLNLFMVNLRGVFEGKYKGWYYRERDGVFVATVSDTSNRKIHLGHFRTSDDAKIAYVNGKFRVLDSILIDYDKTLSPKIKDGFVSLKNKILLHYNLRIEDLEIADSLKIKRKRKYIKNGGEEILVIDFANMLEMDYRHLYSLLYLKA